MNEVSVFMYLVVIIVVRFEILFNFYNINHLFYFNQINK
jgi:hypothetical protein